jgi:hypothetical protein
MFIVIVIIIITIINIAISNSSSRSQSPYSLRRGSAAPRLLGLPVRISPGHGCVSLVSVVFCQVEVRPSAVCLSVIVKPR